MAAGICEDCPFWQPFKKRGAADEGRCRRHAPKPGLCEWDWPVTAAGDDCGEHPDNRRATALEHDEERDLWIPRPES